MSMLEFVFIFLLLFAIGLVLYKTLKFSSDKTSNEGPFSGLGENELIKKFKSEKMTVVLAINKIDMLKDKTELMKKLAELSALYDFKAIVPVSAQSGDGLDALLDELKALSVESIHFFPDDTLTDQPERVLVAEIIREKMLRLLDKEIPHGTAVAIERMRERDDGSIIDVEATIYC